MNDSQDSTRPGRGEERSTKAVKIIMTALMIVSLLGGLAALAWNAAFNVQLTDPKKSAEIYDDAMARLREQEKIPDRDNGFAPFAQVMYLKPPAQALKPWQALSNYCTGRRDRIREELARDQARAWENVQLFKTVLPQVEASVVRKNFLVPRGGNYTLSALEPNWLLTRAIAQDLTVLGVYEEMHGKPDLAVRYYLHAIHLGALMGTSGATIQQMLSLADIAIGFNGLQGYVAEGNPDAAACRAILKKLDALPLDKGEYLASMDTEYALALNEMDHISRGGHSSALISPPGLPLTGAFAEREKKYYMNIYLKYRPCFETLTTPRERGLAPDQDVAALRKARVAFCLCLLPNYSNATAQKKLSLTKISALRIMTALRLYRLEHGKFPAALADLAPAYLKEIPRDRMSPNGTFTYSAQGSSYLLSSASPVFSDLGLKSPYSWFPLEKSDY